MKHGDMKHGPGAADSHGATGPGHAAAHWAAPAHAQSIVSPVPATPGSIQSGETLYQQNCSVCHGVAGRGDGPAAASLPAPPANLFEMAPRHSDGEISWKIANGRGAMPGWDGVLETAQIWDLVNYLRDLPRAAAGTVDPIDNGQSGGHGNSHSHD